MPNENGHRPKPSGGTRKPSLPPGLRNARPSVPANGKKGVAKPAGPPPGKKSGTRKPTLPPGFTNGNGKATLSRKDFQSDQEVRWCPGCGDYVILAQVQRLLPTLGVPKKDIVFISGIGCSGRFPYYMDTYGMHSIHGRAPAIATGLKTMRPELDVWIVTGDGDALSIGGNHLIHLLRRNLNVQLLLFNNEIYGLTKGQYSPTSEVGKVTKSTPYGSVDRPVNPVGLALGADASFVARTMDRAPKHLTETLKRAHEHEGTSIVEIYQNCNVFNDGAFQTFTDRTTQAQRALFLEDGEPMLFDEGRKGIRIDPVNFKLQVVDLERGPHGVDEVLVHNVRNREIAHVLGQLFWDSEKPRPFGVIYQEDRPTYEQLVNDQVREAASENGRRDVEAVLLGSDTWTVQ